MEGGSKVQEGRPPSAGALLCSAGALGKWGQSALTAVSLFRSFEDWPLFRCFAVLLFCRLTSLACFAMAGWIDGCRSWATFLQTIRVIL